MAYFIWFMCISLILPFQSTFSEFCLTPTSFAPIPTFLCLYLLSFHFLLFLILITTFINSVLFLSIHTKIINILVYQLSVTLYLKNDWHLWGDKIVINDLLLDYLLIVIAFANNIIIGESSKSSLSHNRQCVREKQHQKPIKTKLSWRAQTSFQKKNELKYVK